MGMKIFLVDFYIYKKRIEIKIDTLVQHLANCKRNTKHKVKFCLVLEKEYEIQGGAVSRSGNVSVY